MAVVFVAAAAGVGVVALKLALANLLDTSIWAPIVFAGYATSRTSWILVLNVLSTLAGETLGAKLGVFIKNFLMGTEAWVFPAWCRCQHLLSLLP